MSMWNRTTQRLANPDEVELCEECGAPAFEGGEQVDCYCDVAEAEERDDYPPDLVDTFSGLPF